MIHLLNLYIGYESLARLTNNFTKDPRDFSFNNLKVFDIT